MPTIPTGTPLRDKATGQLIGFVAFPASVQSVGKGPASAFLVEPINSQRLQVVIEQLEIAIEANTSAFEFAIGSAARFFELLGINPARGRLAALRWQAKRKGRPGWKRIHIPGLPKLAKSGTPSTASAAKDDRRQGEFAQVAARHGDRYLPHATAKRCQCSEVELDDPVTGRRIRTILTRCAQCRPKCTAGPTP